MWRPILNASNIRYSRDSEVEADGHSVGSRRPERSDRHEAVKRCGDDRVRQGVFIEDVLAPDGYRPCIAGRAIRDAGIRHGKGLLPCIVIVEFGEEDFVLEVQIRRKIDGPIATHVDRVIGKQGHRELRRIRQAVAGKVGQGGIVGTDGELPARRIAGCIIAIAEIGVFRIQICSEEAECCVGSGTDRRLDLKPVIAGRSGIDRFDDAVLVDETDLQIGVVVIEGRGAVAEGSIGSLAPQAQFEVLSRM